MNLVSFLDLLASAFLLYGMVVLVLAMVKGRRVYMGLTFLVAVYLLNSIPNFVEWIGFEHLLDPFEDYMLMLVPAGFFLFFSFSVFAEEERDTATRNKVFMALHSITENVALTDSTHALWHDLLDRVITVMGLDGGFIHLPDQQDLLNLHLDWEGSADFRQQAELIDPTETILSEVLMSRKPLVIQHTHNMPDSFVQALHVCGVHSVALVPVYSEMRVLGVMGILSLNSYDFSHEEVDLFSLLGHHFGEIILNATLVNEAREHSRELSGALSSRQHFLTIVADDLKDPLLRIRTAIQRLGEEVLPADRPDLKSLLQDADSDSEKLEKLIDDVRELSLLDSGDMVMNVLPVDVRRETARMVDQFQDRARRKQVQLVFESEMDPVPVEMDKDLYRSALRHLLSNAVKYTPDGGTITVSVNDGHGDLLVKVSDSGIGIEETDAEKVFDMFYRTSTARMREKTGTGLGLTIVKKIVDLHGGDVTFESMRGEGTVFVLRLPRIQLS